MQNGDNFDCNYLLHEESPQTEECFEKHSGFTLLW